MNACEPNTMRSIATRQNANSAILIAKRRNSRVELELEVDEAPRFKAPSEHDHRQRGDITGPPKRHRQLKKSPGERAVLDAGLEQDEQPDHGGIEGDDGPREIQRV